ncbi:hypothetical protein [Arthrobacter glacialis]|uniref:Uncharacterized protein n=1 Tax=Arthrobacter glacialis TaxID=1664 RepID=A0A2S3ZWD4_ARTGL|nr:hypothetical protein CVS27_10835 [Arthrobacter glacialis]
MSLMTPASKKEQGFQQVSDPNTAPRSLGEQRAQIAAARLQVTLDRRLGRKSSSADKALAKKPL